MENMNNQKINLLKKIAELRQSIGGNKPVSGPTNAPKPSTPADQKTNNNTNNGSRGCGACSRKKNS
jgi:hypothetical protein